VMLRLNVHLNVIVIAFGLLVAGVMYLLWRKHGHDQD